MTAQSCLLIGHDTLAVECGQMLLAAGHQIAAVVTRHPQVASWASGRGLAMVDPGAGLAARLPEADWLFSIANLDILPAAVLARARQGAVNFHDGPLPRYAGLNAPVWAILNGEARHGVTWHLIEGGVDEGRILAQRLFDLAPDETAASLNARCFAAGIESFADVVRDLGRAVPQAQDLSQRSLYLRDARPIGMGRIDWTAPATVGAALVRAMDHGDYPNPMGLVSIAAESRRYHVGAAEAVTGAGAPGTVLSSGPDGLVVAAGTGALRLTRLRDPGGAPVNATEVATTGTVLPSLSAAEAEALAGRLRGAVAAEPHWRRVWLAADPAPVPPLGGAFGAAPLARDMTLPGGVTADDAMAAFAAMIAESAGRPVALALARPDALADWQAPVVPVIHDDSFAENLARARALAPPLVCLPLRLGRPAPGPFAVGLADDLATGLWPGLGLLFAAEGQTARLTGCPAQLSPAGFALLADRLAHRLTATGLPEAERALLTTVWNATGAAFAETCLHDQIAAQAARSPDAPALHDETGTLSFADLDRAANRLAHVLRAEGVGPGVIVGLHLRRSAQMVIGALAILKAGGAYLPLDPAYPAERTALYLEDSAAPVIVTEAALAPALPAHAARVVLIDTDPRVAASPGVAPVSGALPGDLAYVIYTSGSTGRPKGVMIEHRQVANFLAGMDARIARGGDDVWLAVTSLSFDISVLELFWTLSRGIPVALSSDENRALVSGRQIAMTGRGMQFSLFYWGNDDGAGRDKYALLLDGARFADDNGFCAVWTPERHFHAFGGPYPNPSVTGAAVAAVTRNLAVRAGSCVAPLHHPARIAEEWAVIDNLTNGRAGLAIASGWQPDDFVLRPENAPPANKAAMLQSIADLRRLWSGEAVAFPTAGGGTFAVTTQPRPVSKTLPIWVTTAGNPDTWREAGAIGANVLTHLLGQSVAEVEGKIALYHEALRKAGHDPANHTVTLMLHTYLADTRDQAEAVARGPMKDYLRSAAALIKQYAWAFPAFKKPQGVSNPMDIDLRSLEGEELEAILDFAFLRYFNDSGLFGTVDDALQRVEELKRIGVDEIACLIDYGIPRAQVMEGLKPLAEVLRRANLPDEVAEDDFSIAAQIVRHRVTHLQCTPSMARMLATSPDSRPALARLKHLLIGGEALPQALAADLKRATRASITNMYGPTETTIWSTTAPVTGQELVANIGTPIANTQVYVLDPAMNPVPVGVAGELWIGGAGVARGYLNRPDLTAERFRPDPFTPGGRLYRTGDMARWRVDGTLDFLGRGDGQVKLRGYRIELGEVEAALEAIPGVTQAVALVREDTPGAQVLVAYVTGTIEESALKAQLAARLPEPMVPGRIVRLSAMPLTPNRKVDRKALPAPTAAAAVAARPPGQGTEARIAAIWSRILGVSGIGARDSFFDLGGHSLLAVQAHRDIRSELGAAHLAITDIFRFPTLAALARRVDEGLAPKAEAPVTTPDAGDAMARRREMRARRAGG